MDRLKLHIISIVALVSVLLASCTDGYPGPSVADDWEGTLPPNQTLLVLRISPIAVGSATAAPVEKIKSVRVVIVNIGSAEQPAVIECNRSIDLPAVVAGQFQHSVMWPTVAGPKKVYIFANESSIGPDITDTLDSFEENTDPAEFIAWADNYHFKPVYTPAADGSIYLPYTAFYDNVTAVKGQVNNLSAYLVPVATKFVFNFYNSRPDPVKVNGISLKYVNSDNYLFARVDTLYRTIDGREYYWIDWLAKISEGSHDVPGFSPNLDYNNYFGWISGYSLPADESITHVFVDTDTKNNAFAVPAGQKGDDYTPAVAGEYTVGPVYLPESKNLINVAAPDDAPEQEKTLEQQTYYLTILLEDTAVGSVAPDFTDMPMPNLQALFRNTYVVVNVRMTDNDVMVFAMIADWNTRSTNGWVEEGQAPGSNPLAARFNTLPRK